VREVTIGRARLILGDCRDVLPTLGKVDAIICDLPYGTTQNAWDSVIPLNPMWAELTRIIKPRGAIVLTSAQPFTTALIASNMGMFKYSLVWAKTMPTNFLNAKNRPLTKHEDINVFSYGTTANGSDNKMNYYPVIGKGDPYKIVRTKDRRVGAWEKGNRTPFKNNTQISDGERYPTSILEFSNSNHESEHETQKPVALFEYLIRTYTQVGELVADFTVGSGTTAVASRNLGRDFIVGDYTLEYCEIARRRLAQPFTPQMFADEPTPTDTPKQGGLWE